MLTYVPWSVCRIVEAFVKKIIRLLFKTSIIEFPFTMACVLSLRTIVILLLILKCHISITVFHVFENAFFRYITHLFVR